MVVALFMLLFGAVSASAQQQSNGCGPLPQNRELYQKLINDSYLDDAQPWQQHFQKLFPMLEKIFEQTPDDIGIGSLYLQLAQKLGPEQANEIRRRIVERAGRETSNASAQYMAGLVSPRNKIARQYFSKAITLDPGFGWAYYQRVRLVRYSQNDFPDTKLREQMILADVRSVLEQCTEHPGLALLFHVFGDESFWKPVLVKDRELLRGYARDRFARIIPFLQSLRSRYLPSEQAARLLREDLKLLEGMEPSLEVLGALVEGYKDASNFRAVKLTQQKILKQYPCSRTADDIRDELFWKPRGGISKSVEEMDGRDLRAYRVVVNDSVSSCSGTPGTLASFASVYYRLAAEGTLSRRELIRGERFISTQYWLRAPFFRFGVTYNPAYRLATLHLRQNRVSPRDVQLLEDVLKNLARWREDETRKGVRQDQGEAQQKMSQLFDAIGYIRVLANLARVEASLHNSVKATQALAQISDAQLALLRQGLDDPDMRQSSSIALSDYWRARAALAGGLNGYAFRTLAAAYQPPQGLDHDSRLEVEIAGLARELGIGNQAVVPDPWLGTPEGKAALEQALAFTRVANGGKWENLSPALQLPIELPRGELTDMNGKNFKFSAYIKERKLEGKPLLVAFWATWCGPCQKEFPLLRDASRKFPGQIVVISIDDNRLTARRFLEDNKLTFPAIMLWGDKFFERLRNQDSRISEFIPKSLIVINNEGTYQSVGFNASTPPEAWFEEIRKRLTVSNK